jgi:hypothetical protein
MTHEERIASLEARVDALDGYAARIDLLTTRVDTIQAPNPYVARVRGAADSALSYVWTNKGSFAGWFLAFAVLAMGAPRGCNWSGIACDKGISCEGLSCDAIKPGPPAPIPEKGLRVLIVYKSADLSKYPSAQVNTINSSNLKQTLAPKLAKGPKGPEMRVLPDTTDMTNETDLWQKAMKRPRTIMPWIVVSNGDTGYEGPLPPNEQETLALITKYAE